jgi:predicted dehydrogenase
MRWNTWTIANISKERTMSESRICIIGAGSLSSSRIYPYIGAAGGQIVGTCDLDLDKAERNTRRFGGGSYTDYDAMLSVENPDAVIVCIGPQQHAELAIELMQRGLPVYTEKPPAITAAEALQVAHVAADTGMLCVTAFKKRYAKCYERAREWIDAHSPDDRLSLAVKRASGRYANEYNPRSQLLLDFGIHGIDLISYLFGDVHRVFALSKDCHAYAVSMEFACGAVGSFNLDDGRSFTIPTEEVDISLTGGNWMTIHNSASWRIAEGGKPTEWREPPTFASSGDSGNDTGHLAELVDFIAAVREDRRTSRSSIAESYRSMVLYEAIAQSTASGEVVDVLYEL